MKIISIIDSVTSAMWHMLTDASIYILFGLLVGGMLKIFLSPAYIAQHLGKGRFRSVIKAALLGIPIPLCSCGVLPAAATLKKEGANNGAITAFLIATPESGVDSIAISYALLDPIMTIARPVAAFISALVAGFTENYINYEPAREEIRYSSIKNQIIVPHQEKKSLLHQLLAGLHYAKNEIWGDLAGWFFLGLCAASLITTFIPREQIGIYLGGGLTSMLLMLLVGIPLYICATASTPVAAALILKGVSPGTALVFLLVGPATNITSLAVLVRLLGKRATALYLISLSTVSVLCGLLLDLVYLKAGISATAEISQAADAFPIEVRTAGAVIILLLSLKPLHMGIRQLLSRSKSTPCNCGGCCKQPTLSSTSPQKISAEKKTEPLNKKAHPPE